MARPSRPSKSKVQFVTRDGHVKSFKAKKRSPAKTRAQLEKRLLKVHPKMRRSARAKWLSARKK